MDSGSSIIIIIYPTLSPAIGGRDGMDGSGGHWMTHSIISTHMAQQALPCCWVHFVGVSGGIKTYIGSIMLIKTHPTIYLAIEGGERVDGGG